MAQAVGCSSTCSLINQINAVLERYGIPSRCSPKRFCSHLAMKGAPARAIHELAGHADLATTQRYMHVSPAATEDAIRLLDMRLDAQSRVETGDILDSRSTRTASN